MCWPNLDNTPTISDIDESYGNLSLICFYDLLPAFTYITGQGWLFRSYKTSFERVNNRAQMVLGWITARIDVLITVKISYFLPKLVNDPILNYNIQKPIFCLCVTQFDILGPDVKSTSASNILREAFYHHYFQPK